MSSIGLNSNTYRVTSKYLDFLNDFLVKIKVHQQSNMDNKKDQLLEFLSKVNDENSVDPQMQLLSSIIERELRPRKEGISHYLSTLITEVKANDLKNSIPKIEFLVSTLDNENGEALAKINGE